MDAEISCRYRTARAVPLLLDDWGRGRSKFRRNNGLCLQGGWHLCHIHQVDGLIFMPPGELFRIFA